MFSAGSPTRRFLTELYMVLLIFMQISLFIQAWLGPSPVGRAHHMCGIIISTAAPPSVFPLFFHQMSLPMLNRSPKYWQSLVYLVSAEPSANRDISSLKFRMRLVVSLGPLPVKSILSTFICNPSSARVESLSILPSIFRLMRNIHVLYHTWFKRFNPLSPAHAYTRFFRSLDGWGRMRSWW